MVVATAQSYRKKSRISIFVTLQEEWSVIVYNDLFSSGANLKSIRYSNLPCIPDIRKSHHVVVISWALGGKFHLKNLQNYQNICHEDVYRVKIWDELSKICKS